MAEMASAGGMAKPEQRPENMVAEAGIGNPNNINSSVSFIQG